MKNLAKEIIALDRIARKKIELLENEKKDINLYLENIKKDLTNSYVKEVEDEIAKAKKEAISEVLILSKNAESDYQKDAQMIITEFNRNKNKWIDEIFFECVS